MSVIPVSRLKVGKVHEKYQPPNRFYDLLQTRGSVDLWLVLMLQSENFLKEKKGRIEEEAQNFMALMFKGMGRLSIFMREEAGNHFNGRGVCLIFLCSFGFL